MEPRPVCTRGCVSVCLSVRWVRRRVSSQRPASHPVSVDWW